MRAPKHSGQLETSPRGKTWSWRSTSCGAGCSGTQHLEPQQDPCVLGAVQTQDAGSPCPNEPTREGRQQSTSKHGSSRIRSNGLSTSGMRGDMDKGLASKGQAEYGPWAARRARERPRGFPAYRGSPRPLLWFSTKLHRAPEPGHAGPSTPLPSAGAGFRAWAQTLPWRLPVQHGWAWHPLASAAATDVGPALKASLPANRHLHLLSQQLRDWSPTTAWSFWGCLFCP